MNFINSHLTPVSDRLKGNRKLKSVLFLEGIAIFVMMIFPPFYIKFSPGIETFEGYGFILNPPVIFDSIKAEVYAEILLLQIGSVILLGLMYWLLFRDKP